MGDARDARTSEEVLVDTPGEAQSARTSEEVLVDTPGQAQSVRTSEEVLWSSALKEAQNVRTAEEVLVDSVGQAQAASTSGEVLWSSVLHEAQSAWSSAEVLIAPASTDPAKAFIPGPIDDENGCLLGCCTDTEVDFTYRCGSPSVLRTEDVTDVRYGRVLNDASTAQVTVAVAGGSGDECCENLGDLRTWCHEVAIYRCGTLQWSGPITRLTWSPGFVEVEATDIIAWLDALPLQVGIETDGFVDVTEIARQIIVANLGPGGAGCMVLDVRPSGVTPQPEDFFLDSLADFGEVETVGAALRLLSSEYGLNFTAIGRRLVLFGATPLSALGSLTDADFSGGISVVEDGSDATTLAVVTGGFDPQVASVDGVCGVIGRVIHMEDSEADEEDGLALAQRVVAGGYPTPLRVEVPEGAALAPEAPVCLHEMVPGVEMRVLSNETCRSAASDLRLTSVTVLNGSDGETVQVTLESPDLVSVV